MKPVTVVGSGIIGLTSAIALQEAGFQVKIIAKESFQNSLSNKVGAIWFPFEIAPKEKTNTWATQSYTRYLKDLAFPSGVSVIPFINAYTSDSNTDWKDQLPKGTVREATKEELPKGIDQALYAEVPLVEPGMYLPYLFYQFLAKGGQFQIDLISSLEEMAKLDDLVVNCTGLGAKELCNDKELYPIRGQILRCEKMDSISFADPTKKGALRYIINRSGDTIIGGTDYENDWNRELNSDDTQIILKRIKDSGITQTPRILEELVGLRPKRTAVRFEYDLEFPNVFHNYGHGGAGYTVAWGCAMELADVLKVG
ncbi:FAD-dependent oxidoreductase [Algoriphagus machipongonensis]|uniref:D-amino-acid oxidase n=1 Tax=Algoriphagus machipongonensis TaxID=388413 RepID=A3HYQ1_9BACT|nr:FAD-dependent oxidoreductase [Algoriphagus machipongonensis]EAZ80387.2 D-aspartate oxidase [Algoriphagus machipongonensis]